MPSWWGKSSSKDEKKKTKKENFIDTLHRFISSTEQKGNGKSGGARKRGIDTTLEKEFLSRAESRSMSPSTQVSRCQSFSDRPHAQPLPLPGLQKGITRTASGLTISKPMLEKRGRPQLHLPLPTPDCAPRRLNTNDIDGDIATASISSNCSVDSDDPADSRLHSPVGNDFDNSSRPLTCNPPSILHRDQPPNIARKSTRETVKPSNLLFNNPILSTSPKRGIVSNHQTIARIPRHGAFASAPDSSLSSPSRSPMRVVCPEQIPPSIFWTAKPYSDVTFLGSGQCSSPGSGQTSGHNSMGGDMLAQSFWQHSRGSPECSPIPSPRMTSAGPSSRIHSGAVSPLHPRAGGTAPESPSSRHEEGKKKSHRLPLPPINISNISPFSPNNMQTITSSIPRSPGRTDNPQSPGSRWKKGKMIGRGTFGHVYVGFNSDSGEMCAMKEVTLFLDDPKSKESTKQLGQEISVLSRLRHQNIVQYYGCEMLEDKLYIYLEYVSGGSIHKLLQEYGQFGEPAIRSYTQQILSGLSYLHAKNTVHRDIKGANILVDPNGRVKLADFGMAKHITGQSCPLSFKGSPYWMAPEVIKNTNGCNLAVDIWSLGCTVLEMVTSKPPWSQYEGDLGSPILLVQHNTIPIEAARIRHTNFILPIRGSGMIAAMFKIGNSKELPSIPDYLSDDGKDFIRQCLQREPSRRPTATELLQHPFVRNAAQLEKSAVCSEPLEQPMAVSSGRYPKGFGHARNLSSLDMDGLKIHQHKGSKFSAMSSEIHMRNISCPVSPIGSPLLNSRSPRHANGRMPPSPISSPKTTSGSSTPLTSCNGAIPFNQSKQFSYLHEDFTNAPRSASDLYVSTPAYSDTGLDFSQGMQQGSPVLREPFSSGNDILSLHFGRRPPRDLHESHDRQAILVDGGPHQILQNQLKLNPGSSIIGRMNGT